MAGEFNDDDESQDKDDMDLDEKGKIAYRTGEMDVDECYRQGRFLEKNKLVKNIGKVVRDLRSLGFTSMTEDAYASTIFLLLKVSMCSIFAIAVQLISFHLYIGLLFQYCTKHPLFQYYMCESQFTIHIFFSM